MTLAKPARRSRFSRRLVVVAVVALVVVVGALVGEFFARQAATAYVRDRVVEVLALPKGAPVDVDLGGGSIILQAIAGSVNDVTVRVRQVTVGPLTGSAVLTAHGVPLDSTKPVTSLRIAASIPESGLTVLAKNLSGSPLTSITLIKNQIRVRSEFQLLAIKLPIGVFITPSAANGQLVFTPTTVELNGQSITVEALRSGILGGLASTLLRSQSLCVASYLPKALVLSGASVSGKQLVITLDGKGAVLGGAGLSSAGSCPA
jgi:hypothetical protein